MQFSSGQLAALASVIREGSFEKAAAALHITPSAVSQRIKQLEEQVGVVLVVRASPCTPTPGGEAVYRHAQQVALLEQDLVHAIGPGEAASATSESPPMSIPLAVNADSLATWLMPALAEFGRPTHTRLDITIDDEDHTPRWLRSGRALGVVTSQSRPVQGCVVRPLGVMKYIASANPRFVRRWFADGPTAAALRAAPSLAYNRKDTLCAQFLTRRFRLKAPQLTSHFVPSPQSYLEASLRGLAWGMNPETLAAPHVRRGRLVDLAPGHTMDVPLYWQQWAISSPTLDALAATLQRHAERQLV